jgi:endogenous inhibitor of DNA gyrase (YacG/DUF329 family)
MTEEKETRVTVRCPVCRKESAWKDNPFRPFCSERCRLIDLGKWAKEEYRIEGEVKPKEDDSDREQ